MAKKVLSLALALLMLLSVLTACSVEDTPELPKNIVDDNVRNWYEIFVYSFYDTNNDGIGDLNGVTEKLDYIQEMGFNGIWLMPIHPSPTYHKYDVTDYYAIDPVYGTMEDLDKLITEAHNRGIKVILDLVVNHTSNSHPWFQEATAYLRQNGQPGGEYGDYYVFSTETASGYSPVSGTSYHYEARFWSGMPDLNLESEAVRAEIVEIMDFWMTEHGVDGFRLDAVTSYYTGNDPMCIEFLSWLNTEAKAIKSDCYIVGEAWYNNSVQVSNYYASGVDSFFLFPGATGTGSIANAIRKNSGANIGNLMMLLQDTFTSGTLAPFLGNHDTMRPGSFMIGEETTKMAGGVLSMMNGNIFVYYGEEIGMISKNGGDSDPAKRIAMKWSDEAVYTGWCYTSPENTPATAEYYKYPSVEAQLEDENSILNYYKQAMAIRNAFPSIARGTVENFSPEDNTAIAILRKIWQEDQVVIVMNLDLNPQTVTLNQAELGFQTGIAAGLYAVSVEDTASYDADSQTLTMPAYSIVILR